MLRWSRVIAVVVVLIILLLTDESIVRSESPLHFCGLSSKTSTCPGDHDRVEIKYPFWVENRTTDEDGDCISYPGFQVKCAANGRPVINISKSLYYVLGIDGYEGEYYYLGGGSGILRVVDVDIDAPECPQPRRNISIESIPFLSSYYDSYTVNMTIFYNCSKYSQKVLQHIPCLDNYHKNTSSTGGRSFAFIDQEISSRQFDWYQNCKEAVVVPVVVPEEIRQNYENYDADPDPTNMSYTLALKRGFYLLWDYPVNCGNCELSGGKCLANQNNHPITTTTPFHCNCPDGTIQVLCYGTNEPGMPTGLKTIIGISVGVVGLLIILLVLFRRKCCSICKSVVSSCKKKIKGQTNVELFLDNNYGDLSLLRHTYSDIKKMTNSFKDALGQGGYGSVFRGKLRDGQIVAVKVLNEPQGKGEYFMNEVVTISNTNHVNVVSLLGFCAEGSKRALIYEFMPNGSLEKFIHNAKDSSTTYSSLGCEKLYQIALGIARGLEYLHRGCNTRILHFDIKPHNILLDQDFCPKISDFGFAKLCPSRESIVTMVGARGTIGYIAPEVCCRNFGGVSYKSDVYSYGMMVLEMVGGRQNIDATVENISEAYFPQWIYKRLRDDIKVEGSEKRKVVVCGEVFADDVVQKMIIVSLWCIQAHPEDRPSMTKVVEMLEGNAEDLQLPPDPFLDPYSNPLPSSS